MRMQLKSCYMIIGVVFILLLSNTCFAEGDLLSGKDSQSSIQLGINFPDSEDNQSRVRQFDGRTFHSFGIQSFSTFGYDGGTQYRLEASDLLVGGDESVNFLLIDKGLKIKGGTNSLTHRLVETPAINPWVAEQLVGLGKTYNPLSTTVGEGVGWDTFKNLSPGKDYFINRRVDDLNLYVDGDSNKRLGLSAGYWNENETGQQQLLFRARALKTGVIRSSQRGGVAIPLDRDTKEGTVGVDWAIGDKSVINVQYSNLTFTDNSAKPAKNSSFDVLPLNDRTQSSSQTKSQTIKARSNITDNLQFTGVYVNRERENNASGIPIGYNNVGGPLSKKNKATSANLALVYKVGDSLSFTGRYRNLDFENQVPPIFTKSSTGVIGTTPANGQLSNQTKSYELEGVYTGIPKAYLRFGFESKEITRRNGTLHGADEDLPLPFEGADEHNSKVDWKTHRVSLRYHPINQLNISGNYEKATSDKGQFVGTPNERKKSNIDATFMVRENIGFYCNLSKVDEVNTDIRVATDPVLPTNPGSEATAEQKAAYTAALADYVIAREELAGQGLDSSFKTTSVGAWIGINDRLTLDVNYGLVKNETNSTWILGYETAYLPHLPTQMVAFNSNDKQWSANANYVVNSKLRLNSGFFHSNSDGASYVSPTDFAGLGPLWTPFKIKQNRWSAGATLGISKTDSISADYSIGKWDDEIDPANTGKFQIYRLNWTRSF